MKQTYYSGSMYYLRPTFLLKQAEFIRTKEYSGNIYDVWNDETKNDGKKLSSNSTRKLKQSIEWLVHSTRTRTFVQGNRTKGIRNKIVFITLTYSSKERNVSDIYIKNHLLKPFVKRLRYQIGGFNYVWRIEKHKNGNTHVHLTANRYIHWRTIRNNWNKVLYRNGLMQNYLAQHGNIDANSTDVHSVRKVKHLAAYLSKYMSKENSSTGNTGRLWGCSAAISKIRNIKIFLDCETERIVAAGIHKLKHKWLEVNDYEIGELFLFSRLRDLPRFFRQQYSEALYKLNNYYTLFAEI